MNKYFITRISILLILGVFIFTSGIGCRGGSLVAKKEAEKKIELDVWTVFDSQQDMQDLINGYVKLHKNVKFNVRRFNFQEYQTALLDAFAEERGPDIFALPNTWVKGYQNKTIPLPDTITLPVKVLKGSIKQETVIELQTKKTLSPKELKTKFIDTVYNDVVYQATVTVEGKKSTVDKIYALPLAVDVLALYYNVDLLNAASISQPASDWTQFAEQVKKITKLDTDGNILIAGGAIGTGSNIERASDIISLLMMQNGTEMTDASGSNPTFHQFPKNNQNNRDTLPSEEALVFYTNFANKNLDTYTWNNTLPHSLEAFISGQSAYFFGYAYHREQIQKRAPRLNFNVAPAPIIAGNEPVYYANYWLYTVSKQTSASEWAWDFLLYATDAKNVEPYLTKLRKPTGLRALIDKQKEDIEMRPFMDMVLSAKSWYHGRDAITAEKIMRAMLDSVVEERAFANEAIKQAAGLVQQTMR